MCNEKLDSRLCICGDFIGDLWYDFVINLDRFFIISGFDNKCDNSCLVFMVSIDVYENIWEVYENLWGMILLDDFLNVLKGIKIKFYLNIVLGNRL